MDEMRPKPVPPPANGGIPPEKLPGAGRAPLQTGQVHKAKSAHVTPHTREQLEAVGWTEGDPIPSDLGQRLKEIQAELAKEVRLEDTELARNWKPVEAKIVNITELPEEQQQEVAAYLQEYKATVAEQARVQTHADEIEAQIPPSVQGEQRDIMRNQIQLGEQAKAARMQQSTVIDDREDLLEPPVSPASETAPRSETPPSPMAELPPGPKNCPRCQWPVRTPFDVEITTQDKQQFMAAMLGLNRFEKDYTLLGGSVVVRFRSLTSRETETVMLEIGHMMREGTSAGQGEYLLNLMELRMVASVAQLVVGGNHVYRAGVLEDEDIKEDPARPKIMPITALPIMRHKFYEGAAKTESLRRMIGKAHQEFQRLVEALEAMANDSDFWKGIEPSV